MQLIICILDYGIIYSNLFLFFLSILCAHLTCPFPYIIPLVNDILSWHTHTCLSPCTSVYRSESVEGLTHLSTAPFVYASGSSQSVAVPVTGTGVESSSSSGSTWKLIKGKVAQTIEDIKSSKSGSGGSSSATNISTTEKGIKAWLYLASEVEQNRGKDSLDSKLCKESFARLYKKHDSSAPKLITK